MCSCTECSCTSTTICASFSVCAALNQDFLAETLFLTSSAARTRSRSFSGSPVGLAKTKTVKGGSERSWAKMPVAIARIYAPVMRLA